MKKIVIEPFNDVWYGACFMHAILPILRYYGVNLETFLEGEDILYFNHNNTIQIGLEKVQNIDYYLGMINYKINKINYTNGKESIEIIKNNIDNFIPVMVWVDCFYLSRRNDTFNKIHLAHCLLVYGYDSDTSELIMFDHEHVNSIQFVERRISYEECKYCMQKYIDIFKREHCISILSKTSDKCDKEFEFVKGNKERFWDCIENKIKVARAENFEMLFECFGNYERLLRVLQYVRRADYSDKIKYSSLIKVLFGRAAHYMTLSQKNQDIILILLQKLK